jgi:hypothetical protein
MEKEHPQLLAVRMRIENAPKLTLRTMLPVVRICVLRRLKVGPVALISERIYISSDVGQLHKA